MITDHDSKCDVTPTCPLDSEVKQPMDRDFGRHRLNNDVGLVQALISQRTS